MEFNHRYPLVGMTGFEPATSCSQSKRATKLRHIPKYLFLRWGTWTRTKNKRTKISRVANYTIPQCFRIVLLL